MFSDLTRIQKDMEAFAACTATPGSGCTRLSFSPSYRKAIDHVRQEMTACGLSVSMDPSGVLVGVREGLDMSAPVTLIGSHLDSVINGGNFDGTSGIAAALEIARLMQTENYTPKAPIWFVVFPETTGSRFGSANLGSRAFCRLLKPEDLDQIADSSRVTLRQALLGFGTDPDRMFASSAPSIARYLELHIEQGPFLEQVRCDLGIGEAISGVDVYRFTIHGRADHAGTTPMTARADSFQIAARAAIATSDAALALADGTTATVGDFSVYPGSYNIIPGQVSFTVDIRSKSDKSRTKIYRVLTHYLDSVSKEPDIRYEVSDLVHYPAVQMDGDMRRLLTTTARGLGYSARAVSTGAFHDAVVLSSFAPTALVFVPSHNGRSHCPEEYTSLEDLQKGVEVLYATVKELTA